MNIKRMEEQERAILRKAEDTGLECDYLFSTTFARYKRQMRTLAELEKVIESEGVLTSKTYVRGQNNLYIHPAVAEYNRTADSANKSVSTLLRIFKNFGVSGAEDDIDPLMGLINGDGE